MDKWIKSPWFIRIVSLFFAILLYTTVSIDENTTPADFMDLIPSGSNVTETTENVPVNIQIDEEKYVVDGVPATVDVTIEGSKSTVTSIARQQSFDLFVDLEGLGEGTHEVSIEYKGISEQLSVYIEPKTVEVTIEERQTKEFDVAIDYVNQTKLADGYELGEATIEPGKVSITSSKSVVEQIAVIKAFVDVKGLDKPIENREVPVQVYDSQGNELNVRVEPETVEVSVAIDNPSKKVPINVPTTGELEEGLSLAAVTPEPAEIQVYATSEVLEGIEEVSTEEIDLSEITESTTIDAEINLPSDVRLAETDTVRVAIELEDSEDQSPDTAEEPSGTDTATAADEQEEQAQDSNQQEKTEQQEQQEQEEQQRQTTFEDLQIGVENLADTLSLTFLQPETSTMSLTATGAPDVMNGLAKGDFRVFVNAADREKGEYQLPIEIAGPENVSAAGQYENATVRIE